MKPFAVHTCRPCSSFSYNFNVAEHLKKGYFQNDAAINFMWILETMAGLLRAGQNESLALVGLSSSIGSGAVALNNKLSSITQFVGHISQVNNVGVMYEIPMELTELSQDVIWQHVNINMGSLTMMCWKAYPYAAAASPYAAAAAYPYAVPAAYPHHFPANYAFRSVVAAPYNYNFLDTTKEPSAYLPGAYPYGYNYAASAAAVVEDAE